MSSKSIALKNKNVKLFLVILCSLVYFVNYFSRKDFAATMAAMIDVKIIDEVTGGLIGMGLFIAYGFGQLISGFLGDKIKPSYLLIFGLGTTALCNLIMPLVPSSSLMIPVWALNGFAQAMLWPPIVRILSDNLDHEAFVRANLVVTTAAHVSTILLYLYVPLCLRFFDWKAVFFSATVLAALAMVLLIISLILILPKDAIKKPTPRVKASTGEEMKLFPLLMRAGIIPIFASIIMMGFLRDGIESWLPTLYGQAFNRDPGESILVSVSLPIFSILSITAITALHKNRLFKNEVRGSLILFACVIVAALPIVFLIESSGTVARFVCLILCCLVCAFMHGVNFLLISCLPGRFSAYGKAATTSGFCNAFTYVGAAISSYGMAVISEASGWRTTVIAWIIIGALGILFTLLSLVKYTKFIKDGEN
jgi:OPA family glycerol-3-phosphate transporter-like MFS transporter